jgi:serine/threonine protein kinase
VLVTLGLRQTLPIEELELRLDAYAEGIASLRHVGRLECDEDVALDALVEDEPDGVPSSALSWPLAPATAIRLAHALARAVSSANEVHHCALVGVRPELVYVTGAVEPRFTGVAPRCEAFLATSEAPREAAPPCFDHVYLAPEVLAAPREEADARADVFSVGAVLAHWLAGEHPFEGEGATGFVSVAIGRRRAWRGPRELGALVDAALTPDPSARPSLAELVSALARLDAG